MNCVIVAGDALEGLGERIDDNNDPHDVLTRLMDARMSSVEFVLNDYAIFRFDGPPDESSEVRLQSFVWPTVEFGGRTWREGDLGYADALRRLAPGEVTGVTERVGRGIRIELDTGTLVINPGIDEVHIEIAMINGWADMSWMLWRPGEGTFAKLSP